MPREQQTKDRRIDLVHGENAIVAATKFQKHAGIVIARRLDAMSDEADAIGPKTKKISRRLDLLFMGSVARN